jgi:hypothetical protein
MHTNEILHDTFIPRWYGRLGNNIQQISNAIYFCRQNGIHFTSPDHPMIKAIDIPFGTTEYKIPETSNNWFYHFEKEYSDFDVDIDRLNLLRKNICEEYILPKLKINHAELDTPLDKDVIVIHIRSGDLYTHFPNSHTQNPLKYYLELYNLFKGKVIFIAEDDKNPIVFYLKEIIGNHIDVRLWWIEDTYTLLLKAKNLATSGAGSFAISSAFCSKNLQNFYCTDLFLENSLNPLMLKEQLNVYMADIDDDKYIKVGEWNTARNNIEKILNYNEDILFRRL